jgi:choline dehydrogenase
VEEFAYIVVGAGTAGCVIAARLSQNATSRVLLIEAGSEQRTRAMRVPNAWPENLGSAADWGYWTTAQADAGPVPYPRGRALGGSGAINAMAHVRGHRAVYDGWAATGAAGWGFADLLPFFKRSERAAGRDPGLRGTTGLVPVAPVPEAERHPVALAFAQGLRSAGCPATDDLSGSMQEGVAWLDLAIAGGERVSAAEAYLRPSLDRPNLAVLTGCVVTGLRVVHGRCAGVSYLRDGAHGEAAAVGEVILCAGAIGTPQVLMLSGIGPADHLSALGIDVVAGLPAVGMNLQDHPMLLTSWASPEPLPASGYNHGEMYAALRSSLAGGYPDLHLFPILLPLAPPGRQPPATGFALVTAVTAPDSVGTVRLASADPLQAPLIDPGLLRTARDVDRVEEGLRLIRRAASAGEFAGWRPSEAWPGGDVRGRGELRAYIRHSVESYYHAAGSCRMGAGADTVVDADLRVHGVAGLRVVDASVMPVLPNANPNATVLAIAERAAELIQQRR